MAQLNLPNVRVESDVRFKVTLTDNGVAVNWTSLTGIRAFAYSDSQRIMAGELEASIDTEDSTKLIVNYKSAEVPQYLGIVRLVVRGMYLTRKKTFDKPVINFVATTAQATGVTVITDPEVNVTIAVTEVSTSLLDEAIDACILATADAVDAAERAEAAAEHGPYIHATSKHWMVWSDTAQAYVDTGVIAEGQGSDVRQTTGQSTTAVMSQKAVSDNLATKMDKDSAASAGYFAIMDSEGNAMGSNYSSTDFEAAGAAATAVSGHNASAAAHGGVEGKVTAIEGKIPSQASSANQLADKAFVNSSIATNTATFRGTLKMFGTDRANDFLHWKEGDTRPVPESYFSNWFIEPVGGFYWEGNTLMAKDDMEEPITLATFPFDSSTDVIIGNAPSGESTETINLISSEDDDDNYSIRISGNDLKKIREANDNEGILDLYPWQTTDEDAPYYVTPNDYMFLNELIPGQTSYYGRYKWNGSAFAYEYTLNNSSFTEVQWAAINSGISAGLIPSGTTSTNKLTNAADVAAAIAAGAEVFTAIYGSTTYADILAAYNAGKLVVCNKYSQFGLICYIDNVENPKRIYFSAGTSQFYLWWVDENNDWGNQTWTWEKTSAKVTTLSAGSTNTQYPSAKCVYDATKDKADKTTSAVKTYASGTTYTLVANEIATLDASTAASGDSISIALPASPAVTDEFDIRITTGSNALGITMPTGVTWNGGTTPTSLDANATYEINISGGLGLCVKF